MRSLILICIALVSLVRCALNEEELQFMKLKRSQWGLETEGSAWTESENPCAWPGVGCNSATPQSVIAIDLMTSDIRVSRALSPKALDGLEILKSLQIFNLRAGQEFAIEFPHSFDYLTKLEVLRLDLGAIYGTIPDALYGSPSLKKLRIFEINSHPGKHIIGSLNEALWNLNSLERISIKNTALVGQVPFSLLQNCTSLKYIDLSRNELFGSIPDAFSNLNALRYFDVSQNDISGPLPYSLLLKSLSKCDLSQLPPRLDHPHSDSLWCGAFTDKAIEFRGRSIQCTLPAYCDDVEPPETCVTVCNAIESEKSPPLDFCSYQTPVTEHSHFQCCYDDGLCMRSHGRKLYTSDLGPFHGTDHCLFGFLNTTVNRCICFPGWEGHRCSTASSERIWKYERSKNPDSTVPFPTTKQPIEESETFVENEFKAPTPHPSYYNHQSNTHSWKDSNTNSNNNFVKYLMVLTFMTIGVFVYIAAKRNYFLRFVQWILRERLRHSRQD